MFRKYAQFFQSIFIMVDILVIMGVWIFSYFQRFYFPIVPVTKGIPPFIEYIKFMILIPFIWIPVYLSFGLYRSMRLSGWDKELYEVLKASSFATVLFVTISYIFRHYEMSRGVFLTFWFLHPFAVWGVRRVIRIFLKHLRKKGLNRKNVVIVGAGGHGRRVYDLFKLYPELGLNPVGFLTRHDSKIGNSVAGIPVIGKYEDLPEVIKKYEVDLVIIAIPFEIQSKLPELLHSIEGTTVDIKIVPDYYPFFQVQSGFEVFGDIPFVSIRSSPLIGWNFIIKRGFDIFFSFLFLLLFSPFFFIVGALIKLTSKGPVIYKQKRVGWDGKEFTMWKFRTMRVDAEKDGPVFSKQNDPRCTPVGKILRKLSLDEIPQLINSLKGDMSIVGPRPERPVFIEEFRKKIPNYMLRLKIKAGITGWAQVNGLRGDTSIEERIKYDIFYIENWSILFDIKIILITIFKGMWNKRA